MTFSDELRDCADRLDKESAYVVEMLGLMRNIIAATDWDKETCRVQEPWSSLRRAQKLIDKIDAEFGKVPFVSEFP